VTDALQKIRMQVMWNRLIAVVEEQGQTLLRTAFSPIVRECGDLSAGVFDLDGRMLAQAVTGTPGHVNSMAAAVNHFIRHFPLETMAEGDIYITNDPWMGTGHLNDFTLTTPCFRRGRLVALLSCTSHLWRCRAAAPQRLGLPPRRRPRSIPRCRPCGPSPRCRPVPRCRR
jgi:N-methylhydantoinase B